MAYQDNLSSRVAIHYYVNDAAAKETLERVRKHGSDGFLVQADVSRVQDIQRMFARVRQEFGTLDIFVANVRPELAKFYQKPMEITLEAWNHALEGANLWRTRDQRCWHPENGPCHLSRMGRRAW